MTVPRVVLGATGVRVSALCQGTAFRHLERSAANPAAERVLRHCLDAGVDIFDTAQAYGWGGSEALLGRVVAPVRDRVFLVTKVPAAGAPTRHGEPGAPVVFTASELRLRLEESLRRLSTDHVDAFLLHQSDGVTPPAAIHDAMAGLVEAGLTRFWGASNHPAAFVRRLVWPGPWQPPPDALPRRQALPSPAPQAPALLEEYYTLAGRLDAAGRSRARRLEAEMLPVVRQAGLGLLAFSPLDAGALAPGAVARRGSPLATLHAAVDRVGTELGVGRAAVSVAWVRARPEVSCVLGGAESVQHVDDMLTGLRLHLPAELRARLDHASRAYSAAVENAGGEDGRIG